MGGAVWLGGGRVCAGVGDARGTLEGFQLECFPQYLREVGLSSGWLCLQQKILSSCGFLLRF